MFSGIRSTSSNNALQQNIEEEAQLLASLTDAKPASRAPKKSDDLSQSIQHLFPKPLPILPDPMVSRTIQPQTNDLPPVATQFFFPNFRQNPSPINSFPPITPSSLKLPPIDPQNSSPLSSLPPISQLFPSGHPQHTNFPPFLKPIYDYSFQYPIQSLNPDSTEVAVFEGTDAASPKNPFDSLSVENDSFPQLQTSTYCFSDQIPDSDVLQPMLSALKEEKKRTTEAKKKPKYNFSQLKSATKVTTTVSQNHHFEWGKDEDLALLASLRLSDKETMGEKYKEAAEKLHRSPNAIKKRFSLLGGTLNISKEDAMFVELANKCHQQWDELAPESPYSKTEAPKKYKELLESVPAIKKRKRNSTQLEEKTQTPEDSPMQRELKQPAKVKRRPLSKRLKKSDRKERKIVKYVTKNAYQLWDEFEDFKLVTLFQNSKQTTVGDKYLEVANKLKRTPEAVKQRCRVFNLSKTPILTQTELEFAELTLDPTIEWEKIAAKCSCNANEAFDRYNELVEKVQSKKI